MPGGLIFALLIALALNNVRGKTVYRVLYFMPFITGSVAVGVIWSLLLNSDFGLFNSLLKAWFHSSGVGWLPRQKESAAGFLRRSRRSSRPRRCSPGIAA